MKPPKRSTRRKRERRYRGMGLIERCAAIAEEARQGWAAQYPEGMREAALKILDDASRQMTDAALYGWPTTPMPHRYGAAIWKDVLDYVENIRAVREGAERWTAEQEQSDG